MNITQEGELFSLMESSGSKLPLIIKRLQEQGWSTYQHHDNWIHPSVVGYHTTHQAYERIKYKYETTN